MDAKDSKLKISRAEHHLNILNEAAQASSKAQRYTIGIEAKPKPGKYSIYLKRAWSVPVDWCLTVGDFAHSARSALDVLAFQLCNVVGLSESELKAITFPITLRVSDYKSVEGKLKRIDACDLARIESLQPYNQGYAPRDDPLFLLHEINRADKHRVIPLIDSISRVTNLRIGGNFGGIQSNVKWWPIAMQPGASANIDGIIISMHPDGVIAADKTEIGIVEIVSPQPESNMNMKADTASEIKFGKGCLGAEKRPVFGTLTSILKRIKEVVREFDPTV